MSQNPYASPTATGPPRQMDNPGGLLGQVTAIAICSIVQGALEVLIGLIYLVMATLFLFIEPGPAQASADEQAFASTLMLAVYGGGGGLSFVVGGLRIIAGVRNLRWRGRVLAIFIFFAGLLNFMTCYCLFTAIGLCVWGCIIYFNPAVIQAFNSRK